MASDPKERINLAALQQNDPYIDRIVETAGQVALYNFNADANEWEKTDVQGTMFIYTRSAAPNHGFIIMNRLSIHNFTEPISKEMEFQRNDPFLLYKSADSIHGIWFYDKDQCKNVARSLEQLVRKTSRISQRGTKQRTKSLGDAVGMSQHHGQQQQQPTAGGPIDIVQMLSRAQHEYNQTKTPSGQGSGKPQPQAAIKQGHPGQEATVVAQSRQNVGPPSSGGPSKVQRSISTQEKSSDDVPALLQELFLQTQLSAGKGPNRGGPAGGPEGMKTLESLEKLHLADIEGRGATPPKDTTPTGDKKPIDNLLQMLSHGEDQAALQRAPLTPQALTQQTPPAASGGAPPSGGRGPTSAPPSGGGGAVSRADSGGIAVPLSGERGSPSHLISHEAPHRIASKGLNPLLRTLATSAPQSFPLSNVAHSPAFFGGPGPAGDGPSYSSPAGQGTTDTTIEPTSPQTIPASFTPSKLLTPSLIQKTPSNIHKPPSSGLLVPMAVMELPTQPARVSPIPTLTREQFKEAYVFMLQNDSEFVTKLYDAYLQAAQSKPKT